jgi:hypothetical protein
MATVGGNPLDQINIWFFELLHELPRIRRHAVEKPALSLGEQDVERDRRFAGAAQPVMTTSCSRGIFRSMFLRLCSRAPRT